MWTPIQFLFNDSPITTVVLWDEFKKRPRLGTIIDAMTNAERFTHFMPWETYGTPYDNSGCIKIGEFFIQRSKDTRPGFLWIGTPGGEGGEFSQDKIEKLISDFYKENF